MDHPELIRVLIQPMPSEKQKALKNQGLLNWLGDLPTL